MGYCEQCDQSFSTIYSLNRHVREVHNAVSRRNHPYRKKPDGDQTVEDNCSESLYSSQRLGRIGRPHPYQRKSGEDSNIQKESSSSSQLGGGSRRLKKISRDEIGESEIESEMDDDEQDGSDVKARRKRDVIDEDDDDEDSSSDSDDSGEKYVDSENSSEDSDDCDSSSEDSSGDAEEDGSEDEDGTSGQARPKYCNFGRWKDEDSGQYVVWRSRNREPYVVQHREWLEKLHENSGKKLKRRIKQASDSQLDVFREIAYNVLNGGVAMHVKSYKSFEPYADLIRTLASEDTSYVDLRRALLAGWDTVVPLFLVNAIPTCIKGPKAVHKKNVS